jgi:hypothetical protein
MRTRRAIIKIALLVLNSAGGCFTRNKTNPPMITEALEQINNM